MGRPPLKKKDVTVKTTLRFPRSLLDRIEAAAGEEPIAAFIREALEVKLTEAGYPDPDPPPAKSPKRSPKPRPD